MRYFGYFYHILLPYPHIFPLLIVQWAALILHSNLPTTVRIWMSVDALHTDTRLFRRVLKATGLSVHGTCECLLKCGWLEGNVGLEPFFVAVRLNSAWPVRTHIRTQPRAVLWVACFTVRISSTWVPSLIARTPCKSRLN